MGIANENYEFILVDFGTSRSISDGGVIENTDFYNKLKNKSLSIPSSDSELNETKLPYVFGGDEAFSLREDFVRPYYRKELDDDRRIFNYCLSRSLIIIENVFGIIVGRFCTFKTCINLQLDNFDHVVMACCVLHNILRRTCPHSYTPLDCLDKDDTETGTVTLGLGADPTNMIDLQRVTIEKQQRKQKLQKKCSLHISRIRDKFRATQLFVICVINMFLSCVPTL
jgi:hypothetical protein